MLSAAFRVRKKKRVWQAPTAPEGERERMELLGNKARSMLSELAAYDADFRWFLCKRKGMTIVKLGVSDGIGLLLRVSPFGKNGGLTDGEVERFRAEVGEVIDNMSSSVLNYSIVLALLLTIFVSLMVLHVGAGPYSSSDAPPIRLEWADMAAAGDAALYLMPQDPARFRFAFYVVECVLLMVGGNICVAGILRALAVYNAISVELPTVVARCEHLLAKPMRISKIKDDSQAGLIMLATTIPCILVRSSAVAFLCACGMWLYTMWWWLHHMCLGELVDIVQAQHREARLACGNLEHEGVRSGEVREA